MDKENRLFAVVDAGKPAFDALAQELLKYGEVRRFEKMADENEPAFRNRVNRTVKDEGFCGFFHVVESNVEVLRDLSDFLRDVENMMRKLDYAAWFNTVCDPCNYVYHKYNPLMVVKMDEDACAKAGMTVDLAFTSHSNTAWICYDMANATDEQLRFDQDFSIQMYWIIEYFARRRALSTDKQLFFMNQYLTVASEAGAFRQKSAAPEHGPADMMREQAIFQRKVVDYAADMSIDVALTRLWKKILESAPAQVQSI